MKRRLLTTFLILTILILPSSVFAAVCTSTVISGGAGSFATGGSGGTDCGDDVCLWSFDSDLHHRGVRIQLYKYTGTGKSNDITLVGKGVDIWAAKDLNSSNYRFSRPDTNNLGTKASCTEASGSNSYGNKITNIYTLTSKDYSSGTYGTVVYQSNLNDYFKNNTLPDFLLKIEKGAATDGWIKDNLLDKLSSTDQNAIDEVKTLFHLNDQQLNDLKSNVDDYYITAEVLYKFYMQNGIYGGTTGYHYYGTASESGYFHGAAAVYNSLQSKGGDVGKLVSETVSGSFLIKQEDKPVNYPYFNSTDGGINNENKKTACRSAYAYAVWHIGTVCEECGKPSCEAACSSTAAGTTERLACATAYCDANEPGSTTCAQTCASLPEDTGCDEAYDNKCATYTIPGTSTTTVSELSQKCEENTNGKDATLSTKICYDDKSSYTVIDENNVSTDVKDYTTTNKVYYKIECTEDLVLSNLPQKTNAYISEGKTTSLYLGYKMSYTKTCELYYKNKKANIDAGKAAWQKEYIGSQLQVDYDNYKKITEEKIYPDSMDGATEAEKKAYMKVMNTAYEEVAKVQSNAITRLKYLSDKDYKSDEEIKNEATIKIARESGSQDLTMQLVPVYCVPSKTVDEKKCSLENNIYYKYVDNSVVCTDKDEEKIPATIDIVTVKDDKKNVEITNIVSSTYTKTIYYALPSSYVSYNNATAGSIYYKLEECENVVEKDNGFCKEYENLLLIDGLDKESISKYNQVIGNESIKLTLSSYGLCGQFDYDLTCDYKYEDENKCTSKTCSCDTYCGSNVACRAKYCPEECEGCDEYNEGNCPKDPPPGDGSKCRDKCNEKTGEDKTNCETTCCELNCPPGNAICATKCCIEKCGKLYSEGSAAYNKCITEDCDCINGGCTGPDYYYRTISLTRPFPGGNGGTREPGANWYGKVAYITDANDSNSKYYDKTNGSNDDFEYRIELSSADIKAIKNDPKLNTTYTAPKNSERVKKNSKGDKVYCSWVLHDYLYDKNIRLEVGADPKSGSGCGV